MAKRFTDSQKWVDPWFMDLPSKYKLFWIYILDTCDHAGVWKVNFKVASFHVGEPFEPSEVKRILGNRIVETTDNYWYIQKFIDFQYGGVKSDAVGKSVQKILERHNLIGATEGLERGLIAPKDKDKVIAKVNTSFNKSFAKVIHKKYESGADRGMEGTGQDVDALVLQMKSRGQTEDEIIAQAKAMKAYYQSQEWPMPTNYIKLLTALTENDWPQKLKETDPEHQAKAKTATIKKEYDEIGTSAPGSLG